MIKLLRRIWQKRWVLRSLPFSIYFNFHYLPFKQAIRLPIVLYKPSFRKLKGSLVILDDVPITPAMIKLGNYCVSLYPNDGVMIDNNGGTIIFHGKTELNSGIKISIGPKGTLEFGKNVRSTAHTKIVAYNHIYIDDDVLIGWDCLFMDSDLHQLTRCKDGPLPIAFGKIYVGKNTWVASKCDIMKNTYLPDNSVVAFRSLTNRDYGKETDILLGGAPAEIIKHNIYLDKSNWEIEYPEQ